MKTPILVTGGAGYIGSHCCQMLKKEGYLPVTFDNLSTGSENLVQFGPLEVGDTRNREDLDRVFARYRPKAVMHFAARALVGESIVRPLEYYDNNVTGSLSLLQACRHYGIESFIFSSTCAVYGVVAPPIPVTAPIAPVSPYGASKAMVERMLEDIAATGGFTGTCFRYFNAAGADPDGRIGERHEPETHIVPNILKAAADGGEFALFGDDYPTRDGTCVRDYVHVCDIVHAHVTALRTPGKVGEVRTYNLGTGRGHSVRQVLRTCERVTCGPIRVRTEPRRSGGPPELAAGDTDVAERDLGWQPHNSDLETIIRHAWKWHQSARQGNDRSSSQGPPEH